MFQNIQDENIVNTKEETNNKKNILANAFSKKYIVLYIITFMISMVGMGQNVSPFSLAIVAATAANGIPVIAVIILGLIGNIIGIGFNSIVTYIATLLIFFVSFFIIQPKYNEESRNEKIKLSKRILFATLLIQIIKIIFNSFMLYDLFVAITLSLITLIFYKIFSNSITVITEFNEIKAFSIEEIIGASLILSIAACVFGDFNIYGFSVRNIISIFIVLVLGWKNGILIGATSGISIGITLGIIAQNEPIIIAAYALSGMIAGILNRFGKIGVIVGFILGDLVLTYVANGGIADLIIFKEILIAGIGLLAVPKSINLNIENILGNNKFLPINITRGLDRSRETIEKLQDVSSTVNDMAESYNDVATTVVDERDIKEKNKQIFISEFLNYIENMKDNLLFDELYNVNEKILDEIFENLLDKQFITEKDLLKIFANNNNYIIGFDEGVSTVEDDVSKMVQAINSSYRISKMNFIFDRKIKAEKENTGNHLKEVSKAISEIASNIKTELQNEERFQKEKEQIILLLKQRDVFVQDMSITKKKNERFILEIYIEENEFKDIDKKLEKIASKVLKEEIIIRRSEYLKNERSNVYYLISEDKYEMDIGYSTAVKDNNTVSGDSLLNIRLKDGKNLIVISDGMGNGVSARKSSQIVVKMLARLLNSGFDKSTSINLINSNLLNVGEDIFATMDIAVVDLYQGNIEFIKNGACPSYIKNGKRIQIIKSLTLPAGIIKENGKEVFDIDISGGEIMVMCSDGILDSNIEYKNKELWIKYLLEDMEENNPQKVSNIILNESIDNSYGKIKDDMSIIVCDFRKKQKK